MRIRTNKAIMHIRTNKAIMYIRSNRAIMRIRTNKPIMRIRTNRAIMPIRTNKAIMRIRTNRAIMLNSSCIRTMTCFPLNRATLAWYPRVHRKQSFGATDKLDGICIFKTGIISDERTDEHTDRRLKKSNITPLMCSGV